MTLHYTSCEFYLGLIMGHCMKKKCYEDLQSLIEAKKHQSVKCYAEYEVLQEFVRGGKSKCDNIAERIDSCNGQDKKKEVADLCDELVRSKGTLKYFQSKLARCEEESKKVTKVLDELCSIEAEIGQQKQQQQQQNK